MMTDRDKAIAEFVKEFRVATRDQLITRFLPGRSQGKVILWKRMQEVLKKTPVKKFMDYDRRQTVYYTGSKEQIDHNIRNVDLYLWLWSLYGDNLTYQPEWCCRYTYAGKDYSLRADGLAVIKGNKTRRFFVEVDNGSESIAKFDKYTVYRQFYCSNAWNYEPLIKDSFPFVLIVAYDPKRVSALSDKITTDHEATKERDRILAKVILWDDLLKLKDPETLFRPEAKPTVWRAGK